MENLIVIVLLTLPTLLTTSLAEQCGRQAGNALCPNGLCCSQYGYCGSTPDYCSPSNNCQSQCNGNGGEQCGRQAGNALCPNGLCCSQYGYCGSTPDYCSNSNNCQSQCNGNGGKQCGRQAGNALCPNGLCCSQYGYCGSTPDYCSPSNNCQSQCTGTPSPGSGGVGSLISQALFDQMLKYHNDGRCPSHGFYTYDAFVTAAQSFSGFGTTGDDATRKREIAAFLGQTSHETTGGWPTAPDGPYAWGYCFITQNGASGSFCDSPSWPCPAGKQYYGRGPIQLTHNYNYGQAGNAIGVDLINNPDLVATDPVISFKTAIWFWMTPQANKPSSHDVIAGIWTPSSADTAAGRVPGYGVITNILNGGLECGMGANDLVADRIGFFKRYCDLFGIGYGNNLDCYNQRPFA